MIANYSDKFAGSDFKMQTHNTMHLKGFVFFRQFSIKRCLIYRCCGHISNKVLSIQNIQRCCNKLGLKVSILEC